MFWSNAAPPSLQDLARQLHAEALAASGKPGLPSELKYVLAAWRPSTIEVAVKVGVVGLPGCGKTTFCQAFAAARDDDGQPRIGLPPGMVLVEGPALTHAGPSPELLDWIATLDSVIFLHPLRVGLSPAELSTLSALVAWGVPVQLGLCQADLETDEREGGLVLQTARVRLARNLAELADDAETVGNFALPVAIAAGAGVPGLAGAIGALWAWTEERERMAAARDLCLRPPSIGSRDARRVPPARLRPHR
jgi:hypothetical protein